MLIWKSLSSTLAEIEGQARSLERRGGAASKRDGLGGVILS